MSDFLPYFILSGILGFLAGRAFEMQKQRKIQDAINRINEKYRPERDR